ncbi:hypothetical protein H9M94_02005 [Mycoplasma sp. Pen4]|uniref:BC85_0335 family putative methyltransferase n=1 Tax=Mycoplasma sp. Pen4 TaxID=640330 RepID=UPI001654BA3E|nr:hypothetical protein [Mycoplasma sp. Pen4]QNM93380.1 hypothetical protein H9M94_02005 [Mycoplasma sp. Pen4]
MSQVLKFFSESAENSTIAVQSEPQTSVWSSGLAISAYVVFALGILIYIGVNIYARKIRNKYLKKSQEESMIQLQQLRNGIGELPFQIKDHLKSKAVDLDVEGIINTIYQNKYKNVLIISENDLFPNVAVASKCPETQFYYQYGSFDVDKYREIQNEFPDETENIILPYSGNQIDFVVVVNTSNNINELYDQVLPKLAENGMFIVDWKQNKTTELKKLLGHLKLTGKTHEVSFLSSKYLFVVNNAKTI